MAICRGCTTSSGGGVPDHHLSISGDGGGVLDSGVATAYPLDPAANAGLGFLQRGTNITWAAGNPTRVTINEAGIYDLGAAAGFITTSASFPISVNIEAYKNGAAIQALGFMTQSNAIYSDSTFTTVSYTANGVSMAAGDYFEVVPSANDFIAAASVAGVAYAFITVTQRI